MKRFIILLPIIFLLGGCERITEPDDLLYAAAIGIDRTDNDEYKFTIQYAKVFEINSGAEGGKSGDEIVGNITVNAPSIYSAIDIANKSVSKRFTLSHLRLIVFSDEVAREGIGDFVDLMSRSREIRPDVYIVTAKGDSSEYLKNMKPSSEVNPAKYYTLIFDNVYSEYIPKTENENVYKNMLGGSGDTVTALVGKEEIDSGELESTGYEYKVNSGGEDISENGSEVIGIAIYKGDSLYSEMGIEYGKLYNILTNHFKEGYLTFYNKQNEVLTLKAEKDKPAKYKIELSDDKIKVNIDYEIETEFYGLPYDYNTEQDIDEYEKEISEYMKASSEQFLNKVYEGGCDVLNIYGKCAEKFATLENYEKYDAKSKEIEFNVSSKVSIRRSGNIAREDGI